jgi:hypothetical protein
MHILQALVSVWILCGMLAFGLRYKRVGRLGTDVGDALVQFAASTLLGGIALLAVLTNDD